MLISLDPKLGSSLNQSAYLQSITMVSCRCHCDLKIFNTLWYLLGTLPITSRCCFFLMVPGSHKLIPEWVQMRKLRQQIFWHHNFYYLLCLHSDSYFGAQWPDFEQHKKTNFYSCCRNTAHSKVHACGM